jgi:phosphoribosylanthranilate isomerase
MWIKICANTTLDDALQAADMGADAVGFVFAPSKRQVTPQQVRLISAALPAGVERVGVFGNLSAEEIVHAAQVAQLSAIQLHGGFDSELTERLQPLLPAHIAIIQTAHWLIGEAQSELVVAQQVSAHASLQPGVRLLIDAKVGGASGGNGIAFDWSAARGVFRSQPAVRLILAGGLHSDNVVEAIRTLQPWGVDVASGVELHPGRKDFAKLRDFLKAVREAA